jgi:hypothetical protein
VSKQQFSKWSKHYNGAKSPPSHDSEVFGPQLFSKNKNKGIFAHGWPYQVPPQICSFKTWDSFKKYINKLALKPELYKLLEQVYSSQTLNLLLIFQRGLSHHLRAFLGLIFTSFNSIWEVFLNMLYCLNGTKWTKYVISWYLCPFNCSFKWACLMYVGCMRNYLLRAGVFIVILMMWLWLWCWLSMSHNPKIKSTNNFCTKSPLHYMSCYSQPTINGPEWIDKNYKSKSNFTLVFKYIYLELKLFPTIFESTPKTWSTYATTLANDLHIYEPSKFTKSWHEKDVSNL